MASSDARVSKATPPPSPRFVPGPIPFASPLLSTTHSYARNIPPDQAICVGWLTDVLKSKESWFAIDIRASCTLYASEEPGRDGYPAFDLRGANATLVDIGSLQVIRLSSDTFGNLYLWVNDESEMQAWFRVFKRAVQLSSLKREEPIPSGETTAKSAEHAQQHASLPRPNKLDHQVRVEASLPASCSSMRKIQVYATPRRMYLIGEVSVDPSDISNSSQDSQKIDENTCAAHRAALLEPRYKVLEFDRTVMAPTSLREILREHESSYDVNTINAVIAGIYTSVGMIPPGSTPPRSRASSKASGVPGGEALSAVGKDETHPEYGNNTTVTAAKISTTSLSSTTSAAPATQSSMFGSIFGMFSSKPAAPKEEVPLPEPERLLTLNIVALLGIIKFTRGYYLIVVTGKQKVGNIGNHSIFAVRSTEILPIHCEISTATQSKSLLQTLQDRLVSTDAAGVLEGKYQSLFMHLDLAKDCFFSYTYDITRPLQQQMAMRVFVGRAGRNDGDEDNTPLLVNPDCSAGDDRRWNWYLASELSKGGASTCWCPRLIHGYFHQVTTSSFGRPLVITLVARRSRHFAGTRFLKRGINDDGYVANDVESEQIADDTQGKFASFVQTRGSIPVYWMQRTNLTVPKPPILLQLRDTAYKATKRHFAGMFGHHGAPICVVNLVKKKERHAREQLIGKEFGKAVYNLNRELPPELRVQYLSLDYSALVKSKRYNVLAALRDVGKWVSVNTGFFCSTTRVYGLQHRRHHKAVAAAPQHSPQSLDTALRILPSVAPSGADTEGLGATLPTTPGTSPETAAMVADVAPHSCITHERLSGAAGPCSYAQHFEKEHLLRLSELQKVTRPTKHTHATQEDFVGRANNPFSKRSATANATERPSQVMVSGTRAVYMGATAMEVFFPESEEAPHKEARVKSNALGQLDVNYSTVLRGVVGPLAGARYDQAHSASNLDSSDVSRMSKTLALRNGMPYFASLCALHDQAVTSVVGDEAPVPEASKLATVETKPQHGLSAAMHHRKPLARPEQTQVHTPESRKHIYDKASPATFPLRRWRLTGAALSVSVTEMISELIDCPDVPGSTLEDAYHEGNRLGTEMQGSSGQQDVYNIVHRSRASTGISHGSANASISHPLMPDGGRRGLHGHAASRATFHRSAQKRPQQGVKRVSELTTPPDIDEEFLHCRHVRDAAQAAGYTKAVVCSTPQQDGAHQTSEGVAKSGLATRLRQYESVGGSAAVSGTSAEYLYLNLQGTTHGFHHDAPVSMPSKADALQSLKRAIDVLESSGIHDLEQVRASEDGVLSFQIPAPLLLPELGLRLQSGAPRVNCVDCMDRTNVAQVCIGVHMFGLQLFSLGYSDSESLDPDGTLVKELMTMYEHMGDNIAMQYGGSEANKRVTTAEHAEGVRVGNEMEAETDSVHAPHKSAEEKSFWNFLGGSSSQTAQAPRVSRLGGNAATELLSSLQRYYANSFTDRMKQDAMNLLLGVFQPSVSAEPLWELDSDQYLHNYTLASLTNPLDPVAADKWWEEPLQDFVRRGFPTVRAYLPQEDAQSLPRLSGVLASQPAVLSLIRSPALQKRDLSYLGSIPVSNSQFEAGRVIHFDELLKRAYLFPVQAAIPQPYKQRVPAIVDAAPDKPTLQHNASSDGALAPKGGMVITQPLKRVVHASLATPEKPLTVTTQPLTTDLKDSKSGVSFSAATTLFADIFPAPETPIDYLGNSNEAVQVQSTAGTLFHLPRWMARYAVHIADNGAVSLAPQVGPSASDAKVDVQTDAERPIEAARLLDRQHHMAGDATPAKPTSPVQPAAVVSPNQAAFKVDASQYPNAADPLGSLAARDIDHPDALLFERYAALGRAAGLYVGSDEANSAAATKAQIITSQDQAQLFRRVVYGQSFHPDDLQGAADWQKAHGLSYRLGSGYLKDLPRSTLASSLLRPLMDCDGLEEPLYPLYLAADYLHAPVEPVTCLYIGQGHKV